MKRILFIYLALVSLAFAHNYDDVLLKAQASIFPKILLLDKKLDNKLIDGKIVYTIVYNNSDYNVALEIGKYIDLKYKGYLDTYSYTLNFVECSKFSEDTKASAIYILNVNGCVKKIADIAKEKGVISFSYDIMDLKEGIMFSLLIEQSTILYLNKDTLGTQKIDFVDSLLQIVKFMDSSSFKDLSLLDYDPVLQSKSFDPGV
ncbi:hypothetical protein [Sulfurimonas sp. HSL3-2]|uniref:hypothetical protein n=1 Tax=Hydrocurvibacter mobilis TaxID=3131936 RepID=UPI0031F77E9B